MYVLTSRCESSVGTPLAPEKKKKKILYLVIFFMVALAIDLGEKEIFYYFTSSEN
jgi:hypothetical protein